MKRKITFHGMTSSQPLEEHTNQKLDKIEELLKKEFHHQGNNEPMYAEVWLKANKIHPHHAVEIHIKSPQFSLFIGEEGADMYTVLDSSMHKMTALIRKEKEKIMDKNHKIKTDKNNFA